MINNVVFDIGNVFVRWSPDEVIRRCFAAMPDNADNRARAAKVFRSNLWIRLNLGEMTQGEAELAFQREFALTAVETKDLFFHVMDHQGQIAGTEEIARRLKHAGKRVFALTDNVHEIVAYLKQRHGFWDVFEGVVVSAEIGQLKPQPGIFRHLLDTHGLDPAETVFFDDVVRNVEGARAVGITAFVFTTSEQCERDLRELGLTF